MEWVVGILLFFALLYAAGYANYRNRDNLAILLFIAAVISVPFMGYMFEIGQGGQVMIEVKDQKVVSFARNIIFGYYPQGYGYPGTGIRQHEFDYYAGQGDASCALHCTLVFRIGPTLEQHQQYYNSFLKDGSRPESSIVESIPIFYNDISVKAGEFALQGSADKKTVLEDATRNAYRRIFTNTGLEALAVSIEVKNLPENTMAVMPASVPAEAEKSQSEEKK